jgi:hypothetical protein
MESMLFALYCTIKYTLQYFHVFMQKIFFVLEVHCNTDLWQVLFFMKCLCLNYVSVED